MKKVISVILVVFLLVGMLPTSAIAGETAIDRETAWYAANESSKAYTIKTSGELLGFSDLLAAGTTFEGWTLTLGNDIVLNDGWESGAAAPENLWANVTGIDRVNSFRGTFDGNHKTVSGICLNYNAGATGIFGNAQDAIVKNLVILNSYVCGTWATGGIFGVTNGTNIIENVYADIDVVANGECAGGFIGRPGHESYAATDTIKNCVFAGSVTGDGQTRKGGFVGGCIVAGVNVTVENCAFYGTVKGNKWAFGGIIGVISTGTVTVKDCISAGSVINTGNVATGAIYGQKQNAPTINIQNCVYVKVIDAGIMQDWACQGAAWGSGAVDNTVLIGKVPSGFTGFAATAGGYPRPASMTEMTAKIKDDIKVYYVADTTWYAEAENSFEIDSPEELLGFATLLSGGTTFAGKTVRLTADIDINPGWEAGSVAPSNAWVNVTGKTFSGTFDGDGHSISGIYLNYSCGRTGILGGIGKNATVKNLVILNSYVYGTWGVGGIFGITNGSNTIDNVYADVDVSAATVEAAGVGGFIGSCGRDGVSSADVIKNSIFAGTVTGGDTTKCIGGFVGWVAVAGGSTTLENCAFYGTVNSKLWDSGGLLGKIEAAATIKNCISAGSVINAIENAAVGAYYGRTVGSGSASVENSIYTKIITNGIGRDRAYSGATGLTAIRGISLVGKLPAGFDAFAAVEGCHPRPKTMLSMTANISDNITYTNAGDVSWYEQNSEAAVFELSTSAELLGFAELLCEGETFSGKTIKLTADINLNPDWVAGPNAPANAWSDTTRCTFSGIFDGNAKRISGVYLKAKNGATAEATGIFGGVGKNATVKNLILDNSYVEGAKDLGAIFGVGEGATIDNVYCDVDIHTCLERAGEEAPLAMTGGLIGRSGQYQVTTADTLTSCVYVGNITASANQRCVGGLVGIVVNSILTMKNCAFYGSITTANQVVGGLFARTDRADSVVVATNCVSAGSITVTGEDTAVVGSIYGQMLQYCSITLNDCLYTKITLGEKAYKRAYPSSDTNVPAKGSTSTNIDAEELKGLNSEELEANTLDNWVAVANGDPLPTRVNSLLAGTVAPEVTVLIGLPTEEQNPPDNNTQNPPPVTNGTVTPESTGEASSETDPVTTNEPTGKKGCFSSVSGGMATVILLAGMGLVLTKRKKDD